MLATLNPKKTGGAFNGPPRHFACLAITLHYKALISTIYDFFLGNELLPHMYLCTVMKFVTPGGTMALLKLRNHLYMHVGPKMAPKCTNDFVYMSSWQSDANSVCSKSSYKYSLWQSVMSFTLNGWNYICNSIIVHSSKSVCHKFRWEKRHYCCTKSMVEKTLLVLNRNT